MLLTGNRGGPIVSATGMPEVRGNTINTRIVNILPSKVQASRSDNPKNKDAMELADTNDQSTTKKQKGGLDVPRENNHKILEEADTELAEKNDKSMTMKQKGGLDVPRQDEMSGIGW